MPSAWIARRNAHDKHFTAKFVLRILATVFSAVSLIAAPFGTVDFWIFTYLEFFLGAWVVSIVWNITWLSVHARRERPIAPAFAISFDLITSAWSALGSVWGWFIFIDVNDFYNGDFSDPYYNPEITQSTVISSAISSLFITLAFFPHFYFFIQGCIDEHHRRKAAKSGIMSGIKGDANVNVTSNAIGTTHSVYPNVQCVDCKTPIEIVCGHCAFNRAARENRSFDVPAHLAHGATGLSAEHDEEQGGLSRASFVSVEKPDKEFAYRF